MKDKKAAQSVTVDAHVFAYKKAEGLPVTVGVTPDVLDLSDLRNTDITIQWTLVTEGYVFPDNNTGIVYTSPGAKQAIRSIKTVTEGPQAGRVVIASVGKPTGLAYAYTITVVDKSTGLAAIVDPTSIHPPT